MTEGCRRRVPGAAWASLTWLGLAGTLGGCTLITDSFLTNEFSGDPFPVNIQSSSGAIVIGMRHAGDPTDHVAVLDLLSPVTVIDQDPALEPSVSFVELTLLGNDRAGQLALPRARFVDAQLIALHPCENTCGPDSPQPCIPDPCFVGVEPTRRMFDGIIGSDALAGDAVRLRLGDNQIFILADIGGSDATRTDACDAVFNSPYRGGGTLVISGTELVFGNRRITLQACLGPDADPDAGVLPRPHGSDAIFVASTGIGISILGASAYERYRLAHLNDPAPDRVPELSALVEDSVYLPSGKVTGRRATLSRIALVEASTSNALAPCRQVYAHRLLTRFALTSEQCVRDGNGNSPFDCPCENGDTFCALPSILELDPVVGETGIAMLVVSDDNPTLQALRTELRPDQPEIDGVLGTDVLRAAEIDVDYPHDRLIARCRGGTCRARPQLAQSTDVCPINQCITGLLDAPACPRGTALPPTPAPTPPGS